MDHEKTAAPAEHLWLALVLPEQLWAAMQAAGIGTWSWERESGRVRCSPTLARLYGLAPGSFEGTLDACFSRVHPEDREACSRRLARALDEAEDYRDEHRVIWPDGSVRWLQTEGRILRDPSGEPITATGLTRDVTAQRVAEEAIRLSEERYRSLVVATSQFIWSANAAGEWVQDCSGWRAYTGQTSEQARQLGWLDAIHPDDRERVWQTWEGAIKRGTLYEAEHRVRKHDGAYRDFLARAAPVLGEGGRAREWIGAMSDITEQKQAKQDRERLNRELEHRQRILEAVLQQMPAAVIVAEPPLGKLVLANDRCGFCAPGSSSGSMVECLTARAFHADGTPYAPSEYPLVRSLMFGEAREGVEVLLERDDGTRMVMSMSSVPIRDERGAIVAAVVTSTDVTEKVRLMRELAAERARLAAVLDAIPSGLILGAPPVGNLIFANKQALIIKRQPIPPPGASGPPCFVRHEIRRLDGTTLLAHERPLARAVMHGEVLRGAEFIFERGDGASGYLRLNSGPVFDETGRIIAAVAAFDDITDEVEARQALERMGHFRELFLGMLGHDLRNPLSAIITGASLLLRRGGQPPDEVRVLERILCAGQRMTRMIDQILDLTRSRLGGGIAIAPRPMDLRELVEQIVEELEAANPGRAIQVDMHGDLMGSWDPDRLGQVIANLLGNALEHVDGDQLITVTVERASGRVRLAVHNAGAPIPPALISGLFDPFRRSSPKQPRKGRGLGLGLYICQQIVAAHGGTIEVESTSPGGTTFTVELPVEPPAR